MAVSIKNHHLQFFHLGCAVELLEHCDLSRFSVNSGVQFFSLFGRKAVIGGMSAGAIGQFFTNPADLVKVQMQMEGKRKLEGKPVRSVLLKA